MAKNKRESPIFEIFVVLAIVAIVAVTGQIMLNYGEKDNMVTGFAIAESEEEAKPDFLDVGIEKIEVNPPSPLIGEAFEIKVTVVNKGFVDVKIPFYVQAKLVPPGEDVEPTVITRVMTKILVPGDKSAALFRIATVTKEGPLKIIATADSTAKLDDNNPSNDQRSKTIIITEE